MNFYYGPPRFLPPVLTKLGLACLAFNRRGHDILSTRDSRDAEGAAYQSAAEAIADNRTAAEWLGARGFAHPIVIGHSHGGMLAVRHAADHPQTPALVLLSAHRGGKGLVAGGSKAGLLAGDRLEEITAQSRELVEAGRGNELILMPGWWYVVTAAELPRHAREPARRHRARAARSRARRSTSAATRSRAGLYPAEEFKARAGGECTIEIPAELRPLLHRLRGGGLRDGREVARRRRCACSRGRQRQALGGDDPALPHLAEEPEEHLLAVEPARRSRCGAAC